MSLLHCHCPIPRSHCRICPNRPFLYRCLWIECAWASWQSLGLVLPALQGNWPLYKHPTIDSRHLNFDQDLFSLLVIGVIYCSKQFKHLNIAVPFFLFLINSHIYLYTSCKIAKQTVKLWRQLKALLLIFIHSHPSLNHYYYLIY